MYISLVTVKFPCVLSKRGNIFAGKEFVPGFDIIFLGRHKQVPQLHGLFRSEMLKQDHKRILDKRVWGKLVLKVLLSDGFHSVVETQAGQQCAVFLGSV